MGWWKSAVGSLFAEGRPIGVLQIDAGGQVTIAGNLSVASLLIGAQQTSIGGDITSLGLVLFECAVTFTGNRTIDGRGRPRCFRIPQVVCNQLPLWWPESPDPNPVDRADVEPLSGGRRCEDAKGTNDQQPHGAPRFLPWQPVNPFV